MKKLLLVLIFVLLLLPVSGGAQADWQTILLKEKGISFKLPREWRHDGSDMETRNEFFTIEAMEWNTPDKELIRIFIHTYPSGFRSSSRKPATKEEMLEEQFNKMMRKEPDLSYSEVKKVKAGSVEGVFSVLTINFEDKEVGLRRGIFWTGYRIYQGQPQQIEINLSAHPKSDSTLRAIFATINVEQDKTAQTVTKP